MRRSFILQNRKRSTFVSPLQNRDSNQGSTVCDDVSNDKPSKIAKTATIDNESTVKKQPIIGVRDTLDILKILSNDSEDSTSLTPEAKTRNVIPPVSKTIPENFPSANPISSNTTKPISVENVRYFSVMWCKKSTKKHKKWEGDAILIVKTRSATLKSLDGKIISSGMGYKLKDLEELDDGSTLTVGGKECEIQGTVSPADYLSGRCFQGEVTSAIEEESQMAKQPEASKKYCNPLKDKSLIPKSKGPLLEAPRYPTSSPNSFVLPRPNSKHQWAYNKERFPIIDVVVDPQAAANLRIHQRDGIVFLYECIMGLREYNGQGAILADEMGLGKTLQCIALTWTLLKQGPYGGYPILNRVLIITPSSLVKNWFQEFKKWLPSEKLSPFAVEQASHIKDYVSSRFYPVLIISYEMFVRSFDQLSKVKFDLVICDEGHRLKNSNIKTSSVITQLASPRRIVLTGTPVQNDLQEFYSIIDFCNPGILGSSGKFKQIYENPILESQKSNASSAVKEIGRERAAELARLTNLFILRRTQDVINKYLPSKLEYVVFCQPKPLQLLLYRKILSSNSIQSCFAAFKNVTGSSSTCHLTCITTLKKLCNHPYLLYQKETVDNSDEYYDPTLLDEIRSVFPDPYDATRLEVDSGKMSVVATILSRLYAQEAKEKVVIASNYTQTLDILAKLCQANDYPYLRLDGSTPTAKRQGLVETFNNTRDSSFVFLLSSKAGGVGLNLIGASRIILYDIDWNPATDLQTMARIWRDGQKKKVYCYRLLTSGTLEEKIYQRQVKKQCLSGTVVDNKDQGKIQFSLEMLKDLFSLQEDALSTTHDFMECNCADTVESDVPEDELDFRSCQLGAHRASKSLRTDNKHHGMYELLKWDHIPKPIEGRILDNCLLDAAADINFVFRNETQT